MAKKKIKIPSSVTELGMSKKKFAKKNNIKLKGKGMGKKEKKHNEKRMLKEYAEHATDGLNKAVKILAENDAEKVKKINKVKKSVDVIISDPAVMEQITKVYKKNPDAYPNMIYLPYMIMNTLVYYQSESISEEEKEIGKSLDAEALTSFCEKILKTQIKRYKKMGLDDEVAFQLATVIPTTNLFKNKKWYKILIQTMYDITAHTDIDIDVVLKAVTKIDKKSHITKKEFLEGFFTEFIMTKSTNKAAKFTDSQKELHEGLIERALTYLNGMKSRRLKDVLKTYIKRRKTAEQYKNDGKRVIKFIDHAHSNSSFTTIKKVVEELIADESNNELYLG